MLVRHAQLGRSLDLILDRSWEVHPVTWSQLTWWDPIPGGEALLSHLVCPSPSISSSCISCSRSLSTSASPPTPNWCLNGIGNQGWESANFNFGNRRPPSYIYGTDGSWFYCSSGEGMGDLNLPSPTDSLSSVFLTECAVPDAYQSSQFSGRPEMARAQKACPSFGSDNKVYYH
uniref:Uncharacterized protein n=1 Tax=Pseudodiaptomus poplesia TaxID=213370 RepID=A0A1S6GLB8_9MAXI|nr:hypothetical protein [Pseudodiaptomus poplesia]